MDWCIYQLGPPERQWQHLPTVAELAGQLGHHHPAGKCGAIEERELQTVHGRLGGRQGAGGRGGWKGDMHRDPVVFWIPMHGEFFYGFAFKQKNQAVT